MKRNQTKQVPIRLCTYIIKNDIGLAPNPFWGYCTLALCTPNHMGIKKPNNGEFWICGFSQKKDGNKLIYAMRVDEVANFNDYYNDKRFAKKKPNINGTWKEMVGDNIYYTDSKGNWKQHKTKYHNEKLIKDTKHPNVFISKYYFYFGEKAVDVKNFNKLIHKGRGVKCNYSEDDINKFLVWLNKENHPGTLGLPRDRIKEIENKKKSTSHNEPSAEQCGRFPEAGLHQACHQPC